MRRPWKVFVRDVGPTFSFATKDAAVARAEALTREYAEVLVYDATEVPSRHIVYRHDREPVVETFSSQGWTEDPKANVIAQEGCDRCFCGCKYWESDKCIDCGTHVSKVPAGTDGVRDGTEV